MSDFSQIIVDLDATPDEAERLADTIRTWLVKEGIIQSKSTQDSTLGDNPGHPPGPNYMVAIQPGVDPGDFLELETNGLEIETGRQVFDTGGNGTGFRCDACGHQFDPGEDWGEAVSAWFEDDDDASFPCPKCHAARRLPEWRGPWQWGFGNLGFEFWNWPPLSDDFIQAVTGKLGHRTVLVRRHL